MTNTTILLCFAGESLREDLGRALSGVGFRVMTAANEDQAIGCLREHPIDGMLLELTDADAAEVRLIDEVRLLSPGAVVIAVTSFGDAETTTTAVQMGVHDHLYKPLVTEEVIFKLRRAIAHENVRRENRALKEQLRHSGNWASVTEAEGDGDAGHDNGALLGDLKDVLHAFERRYIAGVVASVKGDKVAAARILGIGLSSLYRKLEGRGWRRASIHEDAGELDQ